MVHELPDELDAFGWPAEIVDPRWRVVWVSQQLLTFYGEHNPGLPGVGEHLLARIAMSLSAGIITDVGAERWLRTTARIFSKQARKGERRS